MRTKHSFTRRELYDRVWAEPKRTIAAELGISDVALGKACRKAGIPVPGPGYWAKKTAGKPTIQPALPPRAPGGSDTVEFGALPWDYDWRQKLLQNPLPPPPQFEEEMSSVRQRVIKLVGKVTCPRLGTTTHHLIAKLLAIDEEQANNRWYEPRYASPLARRRLKILNALFLTLQRVGCSPSMTTSRYEPDHREAYVSVGSADVAFKLAEVTSKKRGRDAPEPEKPRLYLSLLSVPDGFDIRTDWEDTQDAKLESFLTDIVVELIVAGEARYRHAVIGHHQHLVELKARLEEEERQRKLEAERRANELREQKERERIEHLLEQAIALEKAATIRKFVETIRASQDEIDAPSATIEKWADWALSQADRIDPVRNPSFLQLVDDDNLPVG